MGTKPSVIVYGPPGCGKTTNKDRLKRHFGLGSVLDFGSLGALQVERLHRVDHLILCIDPGDLPGAFLGLPCHSYAEVMRAMKGGA